MIDGSTFSAVSSQMMELSQTLSAAGETKAAVAVVEAAARVELQSDELQNCWGGPFNGQTGREALMREMLGKVTFDAIIETGTFRGITTEWFAKNFAGPIASCEAERLYHLQAAHRLLEYPQVSLELANSRTFLRAQVVALPAGSRVLFYLDAHWQADLPLVEELQIILASGLNAVVVIDDFKIPFDAGYAFDDYGPGKVLQFEILEFLRDSEVRIFFPRLPAAEETGAVRGVCVLSERLARDVAACTMLSGRDWRDWRLDELEHEVARMAPHRIGINEVEEKQMEQIVDRLGQMLDTHAEKEQTVQRELLERWGRVLGQHLEQADERRDLGRALVELRAQNLDLLRQLHHLQNQTEPMPPPTVPATANEQLADAVVDARKALHSLARSRVLRVISLVAPRPLATVALAGQAVDRALSLLDSGGGAIAGTQAEQRA